MYNAVVKKFRMQQQGNKSPDSSCMQKERELLHALFLCQSYPAIEQAPPVQSPSVFLIAF